MLLTKHISKIQTFAWVKKEYNKVKMQEVIFEKSQKLLSSQARSSARTIAKYSSYTTHLWNWMNSYWMFWIGGLPWRFSASSFCDFWKITDLQFHIFLLSDKSNPLIFQMCFIRRTIAYLCQNMINFDVVDFCERRFEEVTSFFWRSVYEPL